MKTKKLGTSSKDAISNEKKMTRKTAISKAGFMAISAATTLMLLSIPKAAHASAPAAPGGEPSGGGTWRKRTP